MAHRSECGLKSAASLNCLVSPSSRESRPYPQSSLYIQYLVVSSLAVHSTCLLQVDLIIITLGTACCTVYCPIVTDLFELLFLEFPLDLGYSTFTHVQASSPSSLDLATIARGSFSDYSGQ